MNRRRVGQTFLSAGWGDFLVARSTAGLESPANRQAGKPALGLGSWSQSGIGESWLSMNRIPSPRPSPPLGARVSEGPVEAVRTVRGAKARAEDRGGSP
jgi:hypothetical protein